MSEPVPTDLTAEWQRALASVTRAMADIAANPPALAQSRPYDPSALLRTMGEFATGLMRDPAQLIDVQVRAVREWQDFWKSAWTGAWTGAAPAEPPRDRRFLAKVWTEEPYYRTLRDAYLLASEQLKRMVETAQVKASDKAMLSFLADQYLNALSPTNFAMTNPEVVERTVATGGANLAQGFAHLVEDMAEGKGIVRRRTAPNVFVKGETIAATPGSVVFQNHLFQLIQYMPTTADVAAEPLLYVPPLVNRFYMIDLQPKSSLVRWLVEQGRTVFVVSWVNPDDRHRACGVEDYVVDGVVAAIEQVRERAGQAPDLFAFCLGGTLVAIALAWLAAQGRGDAANSATLIGAMVDFADMRDWAAFVNEAHLDALDKHLEQRGFIESTELQQLFAAVRANDLIWSSVINHYLLARDAPPSDLLYWFEDGARIPQAFLASYNRGLLANNALAGGSDFRVRGVAIDLKQVTAPVLSIALKDDHVSAWEAVYDGTRLFGGPVTFLLGGSGHNAGVINPPAADKHGYWTSDARPATAAEWLAGAEKQPGSWWPTWIEWLDAHGSHQRVAAREATDPIEPAPGSYASTRH